MKYPLYYIAGTLCCIFVFTLTGCNEDEKDAEFSDWMEYNVNYFDQLYRDASSRISSGDNTWKIIRNYTFEESVATVPWRHIVVHVLNEGTGDGSPLFSDSVRVHYRGRLLPSPSYAEGLVFDETWLADYNLETMYPVKLPVSGIIDGFSTALQHMHIGDRWEVYIPYQLGYGEKSQTNIPAYSTLCFDITLMAYYRAGTPVPAWKVRRK